MILVRTDVHKAAKHYGPFSLYRDILEARASGSRASLNRLLPKLKSFKNIKVIAGAGGSIIFLITVPTAAYGGYQRDGLYGAAHDGSREAFCADLVEGVVVFPGEQAAGLLMLNDVGVEYRQMRAPYKHGIKNDGLLGSPNHILK